MLRQVSMPSTPYIVPQARTETQNPVATKTHTVAPAVESSQAPQAIHVHVTDETHKQIMCRAKCNIVGSLFSRDAMSQTTVDRKHIVKAATLDAVPQFTSLTGVFSLLD
jgi:hypothetical protein